MISKDKCETILGSLFTDRNFEIVNMVALFIEEDWNCALIAEYATDIHWVWATVEFIRQPLEKWKCRLHISPAIQHFTMPLTERKRMYRNTMSDLMHDHLIDFIETIDSKSLKHSTHASVPSNVTRSYTHDPSTMGCYLHNDFYEWLYHLFECKGYVNKEALEAKLCTSPEYFLVFFRRTTFNVCQAYYYYERLDYQRKHFFLCCVLSKS
jgi:hypothetical protein